MVYCMPCDTPVILQDIAGRPGERALVGEESAVAKQARDGGIASCLHTILRPHLIKPAVKSMSLDTFIIPYMEVIQSV